MSPLVVFVIITLFVLLGVTLRLASSAARASRDLTWGLGPQIEAEREGALSRLARQAGWRLTGTELGLAWMAAVSSTIALTIGLGAGLAVTLVVVAIAVAAPLAVAFLARRKSAGQLEPQFGEAMALIAADVRSGSTVGTSLASVVQTSEEPLRSHLTQVVQRVESGVLLGDALEEMARTTGSVDVRILATAVKVQESHGGSIASLIDQIGETVADRQELRRLIIARSASMTMTVRIVTGAVALFVVVGATVLEQGRDFYSRPIGWLAIAVIVAMLVLANVVAAKLRDSVL